jgi:ankyrin repeat protein
MHVACNVPPAAADIKGCCLQRGDTPLICAAYHGNLEVVRMLLGAGAVATVTNKVSAPVCLGAV